MTSRQVDRLMLILSSFRLGHQLVYLSADSMSQTCEIKFVICWLNGFSHFFSWLYLYVILRGISVKTPTCQWFSMSSTFRANETHSAFLSRTNLQFLTKTAVSAYSFLVPSSISEKALDNPPEYTVWEAYTIGMVWLMILLTVHEYIIPPWGLPQCARGMWLQGCTGGSRLTYAIHAARTLIVEPCLGFRLISGFCGKT